MGEAVLKQGRRVITNNYIATVFKDASEDFSYEELKRLEYKKVYDRLMFCVSAFHLHQNSKNDYRISGLQCRDRFCSICASIRAGKFSHKVSKLFDDFKNPHFLTVTFGKRQSDLIASTKDFKRQFLNFRQLKNRVPGTTNKYTPGWWKTYVIGGFSSFEATYVESQGWHLHMHMIVDIKPGHRIVNTTGQQYQYVTPEKKALEVDLQKVGLGIICDIKPCNGSAVDELCKYIVKFTEFQSKQAVLEAYDLKGFRQIQSFGTFYGRIKDADIEEKTNEWRFVGKLKDVLKSAWSGLSPPGQDLIDLTGRAMQLGIIGRVQLKGG